MVADTKALYEGQVKVRVGLRIKVITNKVQVRIKNKGRAQPAWLSS